MRLTMRTNLAARVLMFCGVNADKTVRSSQIAEATNASSNHLSQVIHQLQQLGYVNTRRGRGGGLTLARPAGEITMGELFRDFEADVPFAECYDLSKNDCPLSEKCRLSHYISKALDAFYRELDKVTLADLLRENVGLHELLAVAEGDTFTPNCDYKTKIAG